MTSVLNLPDKQVKFLGGIQKTQFLPDKLKWHTVYMGYYMLDTAVKLTFNVPYVSTDSTCI